MKDLQVQGNGLLSSVVGITDMPPKKKKSKRLAGRSKSLTDTSANTKPFHSNDVGRPGQPYLRRVPTQDDIYKILSETSDVRRPSTSTGEPKMLSPYEPLPPIGEKFRSVQNSDNKESEIPDSTPMASDDGSAHKLTREGTYNVLEPKFVRGPIADRSCPDTDGNLKERKRKDKKRTQPENELKLSSATIAFGPQLPTEEDSITEGDSTASDFPVRLQENTSAAIPSNIEFENNTSESLNQINKIPMQKLYHRDEDQTASQRLAIALISMGAHKEAVDKHRVQSALWFE
jgi:hypothetical protein